MAFAKMWLGLISLEADTMTAVSWDVDNARINMSCRGGTGSGYSKSCWLCMLYLFVALVVHTSPGIQPLFLAEKPTSLLISAVLDTCVHTYQGG